jgi:hypothetical protein
MRRFILSAVTLAALASAGGVTPASAASDMALCPPAVAADNSPLVQLADYRGEWRDREWRRHIWWRRHEESRRWHEWHRWHAY